jgi:lysozyme family protein
MNFDQAFEILIGHEGGYVNNRKDPGGETKFGVSKRAYPSVDIANLTLDQAKAIYRRDFWAPAGCDNLPEGVRFHVFDMAVNSGLRPAIKMLQRAAKVNDDGVLGPASLAAIRALDASTLIARFNGARLKFMTDLPTWDTFGQGWARRIAANLMGA